MRCQLELFDLPPASVSSPRLTGKAGPAKWTRHTVKRPGMCDHCVTAVIDSVDHLTPASVPMLATWRRTLDGHTDYLCSLHAQDQRERDALALTSTKGNQ